MRTWISLAAFSILLAACCSPLAAQSVRPTYIYITDQTPAAQGIVYAFGVNLTTGSITQVPGSPFAAGSTPVGVAVDPTGRFVYVANSDSNNISAFTVDPSTGVLTSIPGSPFVAQQSPQIISVDPTGRFVYVSNVLSNSLSAYTIDAITGVLTPITGSPFVFGDFPSAITFAPGGGYVYFGESHESMLVEALNFATGVPTQIQSLPYDSIYSLAFVPNGNFAYATAPDIFGTVNQFSVNPTDGTLNILPGATYSVGAFPADMAIDPSGRFLYVANENFSYQQVDPPADYAGSISAFLINSGTGALAPMPGSPFPAAINSFGVVTDPSGRFVYVLAIALATGNSESPGVLGFSIDPSTGSLTPLAGSPWILPTMASQRMAISLGPSGTSNPVPMIASLSPSSVTAGGAGFTLQVNGVNFVSGSTVYIGGQARATTFINPTQLNANILPSDITDGGTAAVYVFSPFPGGGASTSIGFDIFNPSPSISSLSPPSAVAGGTGFTLTVNGTNFVSSSIVSINGVARSTTYASGTQLIIGVLAADITNQGNASIVVTNPANGVSGGGSSSPATLTILPSSVQPVVGSLVPASATAGGPGFQLNITGNGFTTASVVSFNLTNEPTTFISATQLTATIPASAIASAGDPVVIVTNPGVGVSLIATFVVNNPPPGGGTLSPPSLPAGGAALTLTITGTNFTPSSNALVNGSPRMTVYLSSTQLQLTLLPSDLSQGGTLAITVNNPAPGGGTTPAINLTVLDYSLTAPTTAVSVVAGQPAPFVLSVAPSNGTFPDAVTFTLSPLPLPTGVSATFSPSMTVIPGSTLTNVTLSFATTAHSVGSGSKPLPGSPAGMLPLYFYLAVMLSLAIGLRLSIAGMPRLAPQFLLALLLVLASGLWACGGMGSSPSNSSTPQQVNTTTGTPAGTYMILVTATSGGVAHWTTVSLTVK